MRGVYSPFGFIVNKMQSGMLDSLYMHSFRLYLSAGWHFLLITRWGVVILVRSQAIYRKQLVMCGTDFYSNFTCVIHDTLTAMPLLLFRLLCVYVSKCMCHTYLLTPRSRVLLEKL